MKFAVYGRKSVYTGKGESIENQIEMCRQYIFAKFQGTLESDITVYEDEGFSAKNTDRPQFQRMLRDIKQKKFDFVVCYRLDRISRSVSDFSSLIEELNDRDISFVCIKEEFDTSKPMGKAMMYIASVFAQLERETIAERVRDNMLMLARTGRWLGGTTPMGFTSEKTTEIILDGKAKSSCKLKINPAEIIVVKTIFEKFLELHSVSGVSKYLIKQTIKSRSGNFYSLPGIKEILQNPVYCMADTDAFAYFKQQNADVCFEEKNCSDTCGLLSYNKRDYKKKYAPRQSIEKWIIAKGKHQGIVSGKKWVTAQHILQANKPDGSKPARMRNAYSLLSGLIVCEKCGSRMFAKSRSGNPSLFDYHCSGKLRGGTALCACQNLGGQQADDGVYSTLLPYTAGGASIYKLLENLKKDLANGIQENPVALLDIRIKKCHDDMDTLISAISQNHAGSSFVEHINQKMTALDNELRELAQQKARLENNTGLLSEKELRRNMIEAPLSGWKQSFADLSITEKRTLIKLLVKTIIWDGKDLHIYLSGA